jgi:hypothetical protein
MANSHLPMTDTENVEMFENQTFEAEVPIQTIVRKPIAECTLEEIKGAIDWAEKRLAFMKQYLSIREVERRKIEASLENTEARTAELTRQVAEFARATMAASHGPPSP